MVKKKLLGYKVIKTKEEKIFISFVGRVYEVDLVKETLTKLPYIKK